MHQANLMDLARNNAIILLERYYSWLTLNTQFILATDLTPDKLKIIIEKIKNKIITYNL